MIKLIATDMDGTLLDNQKRLPQDIVPFVRALKERGVLFVVASGRQYASLRRDLTELVPDMAFIAENGALIMENDRELFVDSLAPDELAHIIRAARGLEGVYPVICRAEGALVERSASAAFVEEMRRYYSETQVVDDLEAVCGDFHDVCKIAFYDEGDAAAHLNPVLQARLARDYAVILSGANWVDVMKPGVDKGRALRMLQAIKGLTPQECMAFGDYLNDKEMLESVAESYAMKNALDEVKAVAKHIAPGNDENGVLTTIRERLKL